MSSARRVAPLVFLILTSVAVAGTPPVAKLSDVKGTVEYTRDGQTWHRVDASKYLFDGERARTAAESSAKLIDTRTGRAHTLAAKSMVVMRDGAAVVETGGLTQPEQENGASWQTLIAQFEEAQQFTKARRQPARDEPVMVATSAAITLSPTYPELAWENVGAGYGYRLVVDDDTYRIPIASTAEMIRYALPDLSPGAHAFMVQVALNDEVVYTPRARSTLTWLSPEENRKYLNAEKQVREESGDDALVVASFMSAHGFLVPAMDQYRSHFQRNPEDNDMRPLLIKAYNDLELLQLREKEAIAYNAMLTADEI